MQVKATFSPSTSPRRELPDVRVRRRKGVETRVALGVDDPGLQDELLHFLDRLPEVKVVGAAEDEESLRGVIRDRQPHAVVAAPELVSREGFPPVMAVAARETTDALRSAIRVGARGFYVWPAEREALGRDVVRTHKKARPEPEKNGLVLAVVGARGGAGTTFLATNLAAALSRQHAETVLADFDTVFGDVTPALGIAADAPLPSITDLAAVASELTADHLDRVLQAHPAGFRALFAPQDVSLGAGIDAATVEAIVRALRERFTTTVLHLPRALEESTRSAIQLADEVLVVVTLDVLGIRSARRLLESLRSAGLGGSVRLLVNRTRRGEVVPSDAELVLDAPVACLIPSDRSVERAQNRGELVVGRRGRVARRIDRLAAQLLRERAA